MAAFYVVSVETQPHMALALRIHHQLGVMLDAATRGSLLLWCLLRHRHTRYMPRHIPR